MPQSLDELSVEVAVLLRQAGVQLAIAEAGTRGQVADCLRATADGASVLTRHTAYEAAGALAVSLRVSPAKVEAFGAISAMVAAEAAADLIDTYEGGWGLVVMAPPWNREAVPGVTSEGADVGPGFIALGTPSTNVIQPCPPDQIIHATLELLREQALRRLQHKDIDPCCGTEIQSF